MDDNELIRQCIITRKLLGGEVTMSKEDSPLIRTVKDTMFLLDQCAAYIKTQQVKRSTENVSSDDGGIILQPGAWYAHSKPKEFDSGGKYLEYYITEVTQDTYLKTIPALWPDDEDSVLYWANFDEMFTWAMQNKNIAIRNFAFGKISTIIRKEFQQRNPNNPEPKKYLKNQ